MSCGTRKIVSLQNIHLVFVAMKCFGIEIRDFLRSLSARGGSAFGGLFSFQCYEHFVFTCVSLSDVVSSEMPDVGNVFYKPDFVAGVFEIAPQNIRRHIRTQISNMDIIINRRSAGINGNFSLVEGFEFFFRFCEGVVEFEHIFILTYLVKKGSAQIFFSSIWKNSYNIA